MNNESVFTNARVVLRDQVVSGSVQVSGSRIADVNESRSMVADAHDLSGDFLVPGLVELHTDHFETHLVPRPGVVWPSALSALMSHDAQLSGAGITTVFDSVCVGDTVKGSNRRELLDKSVSAIESGRRHNVLKVDHRLHLRCEISDPKAAEMATAHLDNPLLKLVSVMDHTPGQRQWIDLEKFRQYHSKRNWTNEEFDDVVSYRQDLHRKYSSANRRQVVEECSKKNIPMASHDDTTPEHVAEAISEGIAISEFPTTLDAAREARRQGMQVVMGAPNVVRGGSHSGNVSALELAREGLLDILSSDYLPMSLICGAFALADKAEMPLNEAVAMVTDNPAKAVGLDDRGTIAPDMMADLVRVRLVDGLPVVLGVWREGRRMC